MPSTWISFISPRTRPDVSAAHPPERCRPTRAGPEASPLYCCPCRKAPRVKSAVCGQSGRAQNSWPGCKAWGPLWGLDRQSCTWASTVGQTCMTMMGLPHPVCSSTRPTPHLPERAPGGGPGRRIREARNHVRDSHQQSTAAAGRDGRPETPGPGRAIAAPAARVRMRSSTPLPLLLLRTGHWHPCNFVLLNRIPRKEIPRCRRGNGSNTWLFYLPGSDLYAGSVGSFRIKRILRITVGS